MNEAGHCPEHGNYATVVAERPLLCVASFQIIGYWNESYTVCLEMLDAVSVKMKV